MPFLPFLTYLLEFQFTHPRGVRLSRPKIARSGVVSIHAPARGAMNLISYLFHNLWFQFTHPRGVRYVQPGHARYNHSFNSRTREGCDSKAVPFQLVVLFQFTHPRGVRFRSKLTPLEYEVSIHAPARGAMLVTAFRHSNRGFNSRTREGCDYTRVMRPFRVWVSIHAPARGAMGLSKRLVIKGLRKA